MPIKGLAVHVVTTRRKVGDKVYSNHLLRHSYREGSQVKSRTVANLSSLPDHLIEVLRLGLKGEAVGPVAGQLDLAEVRPHGHVAAVVGTLRELGFDRIFATRKSRDPPPRYSLGHPIGDNPLRGGHEEEGSKQFVRGSGGRP